MIGDYRQLAKHIQPHLQLGAVRMDVQALGAGASSVTLTPAGDCSSLQIVWIGRGENTSTSVALYLRLNGDTGANYDYDYNQTAGSPSANTPGTSTGQTVIRVGVMAAASASAGLCGAGIITIPFYRGTAFEKHLTYQSHARLSTSAGDVIYEDGGGNWRSTSAITSITLLASASNIAANSQFILYGLL